MSVGLQYIAAVLAANSRQAISSTTEGLFTQEELPAYRFVTGYYRNYGQLPSVQVCRENGHVLPVVDQPHDYYFERARRRAITASWTADHSAFVGAMTARDIDGAGAILERMMRTRRSLDRVRNVLSLHDAGQVMLEDYEYATDNPGLRGVTFGWEYLDGITGGQTDGDITVFVARPGMGKTFTMCNLAVEAWRAGHSVLFVTMEMTVLQVARRVFGMIAGAAPNAMRDGMADHWTEAMFRDAVDLVGQPGATPFHFVSGDLDRSVAQVDAFALELNPDIVFVDAAYLLSPAEKNSRYSKHEVLADVLKGLKQMALFRNVPVTISVQFNREAEKSGARGSNIAGSDDITKIASNIIGIEAGITPYERTRRLYTCMKVRDGEGQRRFECNFLMSPPDFTFVREVTDEGLSDDQEETANGMV